MLAIKEAGAETLKTVGQPSAERTRALTVWIKNRSEFEAAGSEDEVSTWLRFADGRLVVIKDPDPPEVVTRGAGQQRSTAPAAPAPSPFYETAELPESNRYAVLSSPALEGPEFYLPAAARRWLENSGYTDAGMDATVPQLKQTKELGVFYIDTHGIVGEDRGGRVFGMVTASEVGKELDTTLAADFAAGRLIYFEHSAWYAGDAHPSWYAITAKFVRKYMTFSPGAFVFVNSCLSADETFKAAVIEKGAGAYLGWLPTVSTNVAFRAGVFLFDRLTGVNAFFPENPPQRPFNVGAIYQQLHQERYDLANGNIPFSSIVNPATWTRGGKALVRAPDRCDSIWDVVNHAYRKSSLAEFEECKKHESDIAKYRLLQGGMELELRFGRAGTAVLRPVVALMNVAELEGVAHIQGMFGSRPGKVTVGGALVPVKSWSPELIDVTLPSSGPGSAGPLVISVDTRTSQPVPVTEWRGVLRYVEEDRSNGAPLTKSATINLHLRSVIQPYRTVPAEKPRLFEDATSPTDVRFTTVVNPAPDSAIRWTYSGRASTENVVYTLTGSGTAANDGPGGAPVLNSFARVDTRRRRMFDLMLDSAIDGGVLTVTDSSGSVRNPEFLMLGIRDATFTMDEKFNIQPGRHMQTDGSVTRRLEWDAMPAAYAPSPNGPF